MSTKYNTARIRRKKIFVNRKKQNIEKLLFEQTGKELIRKTQKAEQPDLHEIHMSWQKLETQLNKPALTLKKRLMYVVSIAALLALLFSAGIHYWSTKTNDPSSISLALLNDSIQQKNPDEIILIAQNNKLELKDKSSLHYKADGELNVGQQNIKKKAEKEKDATTEELNQIIVPKGRRANITFSDGTKMFVNSGTRVIYPNIFRKEKREIVVEGEFFLEVSKDTSRPFIVKTNGFEVKVLGTHFNVCAYKGDPEASVVLVNGSVEVETNTHNKTLLEPSQLIEINDKGTNVKTVDVLEYVCWKDNMMLLTEQKAGEVLDRLSRYYGRTILYSDSVKTIPISGKLDLRENLEDVIKTVCLSLLLDFEIDKNNNNIIITSK